MSEMAVQRPFPGGLVEWAGHHSGGVRRLFDDASGRPSGSVIRTNLLRRLEKWAGDFGCQLPGTPSVILLVGGPGNGKTEAVESTVGWLDSEIGCDGRLVGLLSRSFSPAPGQSVPRKVIADAGVLGASGCTVTIVPDASVHDPVHPSKSRAQLLIDELADCAPSAGERRAYLSCVNRGVLDDALIHAAEHNRDDARRLLEAITHAVGHDPSAPACWPLGGFPHVAIWPMDAESLLLETDFGDPAPALELLRYATDEQMWPAEGTCPAGKGCPFCRSRAHLAGPAQVSLGKVLRWYELASGKRWTFRDLFSLVSYLLAGASPNSTEGQRGPCGWAAEALGHDAARLQGKPDSLRSGAIYRVAAASYEHALFRKWDSRVVRGLRDDARELALDGDHALMGLYHFLREPRKSSLPATLAPLIDSVCDLLDPALADPEAKVPVSSKNDMQLREIDARFSQSVSEGLSSVRKYHCLSPVEVEMLERLAVLDGSLAASEVRRRRPAAAGRVQRLLREFSCRWVRRTLGARASVVPDGDVLATFQALVEDKERTGDILYDAAKQVERLLNKGEHFEVSLNTTFGQPLPPIARRATLVAPKQRVRMSKEAPSDRPTPQLRFLQVGSDASAQAIPLTYELFKSVQELSNGMSPASLPRTVVALLDTTRARLSGPIVRNHELLEESEIRIGKSREVVSKARQRFVVRRERA